MRRSPNSAGFTLIEVMIVVAIVGILAGIGGWSASSLLPGFRADSAARKFIADVRRAQAISIRLNRPVELRVSLAEDGCSGPGYVVTAEGQLYERVCLHPSLAISAAGTNAFDDLGAGIAAQPTGGCSFCEDDEGSLVFLPTGEIADPSNPGADAAIAFMPAADVEPARPARLRAVGIRSGSAKAKLFAVGDGTWRVP